MSVRPVAGPEELELALAIRERVFVDEQHVPLELERDEYDALAHHWLAWLDGEPVGTARLVELPGNIGKIGRVAVLPQARGAGLGRQLMEALLHHASGLELILDAQLEVIPFYEKLGFVAEGEIFQDAGILHRRMRRSGGAVEPLP